MLALLISLFARVAHLILGINTPQKYPPPLTNEEEYGFFLAARDGDEDARQKLILHNLRLVSHIVRKYYSTAKNPEDLVSIGTVGLVKAVDSFRVENGAKFEFENAVLSPIVLGDRVVGIRTEKGDVYADLVIDACGLDSPVKNGLPAVCGINADVGKNNQFYVYRAFYNRATADEVKDKYKVCLFAENKLGIGWVATEDDHTDLLVGRFEPFDLEEANRTAAYYRASNPSLGTTVLRGGQFVKIPVRQPLSKLVCDGYAAIGDAAYMTVPIIGSGIANSFKAARMLADTVAEDTQGAFSAETLWNYQRRYYKELGNGFAVLACVKEALTILTPEELDYLFDNGVITANDMSIDADTTSLVGILQGNSIGDYKKKVMGAIKDKVLLGKMLRVGKKAAGVISVTSRMPRAYTKKAVDSWVKSYEKAISKSIREG